MRMKPILPFITPAIILLASCNQGNDLSDAYGNFEATEVIISAECQGRVEELNITEGRKYPAGTLACVIDSTALHLQKEQLLARKKAVRARKESINAQIEVLEEKRKVMMVEKERLDKLYADGAATKKQMDDMTGQLSTLDKEIRATAAGFVSVNAEIEATGKQVDQVADQLSRCLVVNPVGGTVLEKYIEEHEIAVPGKPLYKIADLSTMLLRVYVSGEQLPSVGLGDRVRVLVDSTGGGRRELKGTVGWISDRAEFTPKIIQTRKERVRLVYAVKVEVPNDGSLKIGMPGEVRFGSGHDGTMD